MMLLILLTELIDDEKSYKGKTHDLIKRRHELGAYQNITKELMVEDRCGLKQMFRMCVEDFSACPSSLLILFFNCRKSVVNVF